MHVDIWIAQNRLLLLVVSAPHLRKATLVLPNSINDAGCKLPRRFIDSSKKNVLEKRILGGAFYSIKKKEENTSGPRTVVPSLVFFTQPTDQLA